MDTDTILHILNRQKSRYPVKPSATGEDLNDMNREALDCAIKIIKSYAEQPNEPLTMDELRQMEGEPIWTISSWNKTGRWELIENIKPFYENKDVISLANLDDGTYDCFADTYGKTWLAYRRKPEQERTEK